MGEGFVMNKHFRWIIPVVLAMLFIGAAAPYVTLRKPSGAATDNALVRYDGTTGALVQTSGVTVDDSDNITTPGNLTADELLFDEGAAAGTPAASKVGIYAKTDGLLYSKDDAGTEILVSGGSGLATDGDISGTTGINDDIQTEIDLYLPLAGGQASNTELKAYSLTMPTHSGVAVGATETFAAVDGNIHTAILDENLTATTTFNATSGEYQTMAIEFTQDGTGTNTVTFSPVPDNGQPIVDPTPNSVTVVQVETSDGGTTTTAYGIELTHISIAFNPKAVSDADIDRLFLFTVGDTFPDGMTIWEWSVSFAQDPTTEADLDLKYADAFIGVANAAVIDVLDTTAGVASESTYSNINSGAKVANGKVVYLEFGTAYTDEGEHMIFEAWVF